MNAVGIDVSKGKSTVAVLRTFGEVAVSPFDVIHNDSDLKQLAELIKALPGESKVVMEYTGTYFEPIAQFLHNNGIFVSVVNALLVHDYGGNSLRKVKTDKKDALKLASYALDRWTELDEYIPADEQRKTLKLLNRQYNSGTQKGSFSDIQITEVYILNKPEDEPVYQFIDKKRSEGKHYYSYRIAAANKFLRIYFAKVNQVLNSQQPPTYLLIRLLQFFV